MVLLGRHFFVCWLGWLKEEKEGKKAALIQKRSGVSELELKREAETEEGRGSKSGPRPNGGGRRAASSRAPRCCSAPEEAEERKKPTPSPSPPPTPICCKRRLVRIDRSRPAARIAAGCCCCGGGCGCALASCVPPGIATPAVPSRHDRSISSVGSGPHFFPSIRRILPRLPRSLRWISLRSCGTWRGTKESCGEEDRSALRATIILLLAPSSRSPPWLAS